MALPVIVKKLKFKHLHELPLYLPEGVSDNRNILQNFQPYLLPEGALAVCYGHIKSHAVNWTNNRPRLSITLTDGQYSIGLTLFGDQRKLQEQIESTPMMPLYVKGAITYVNQRMYLSDVEILAESDVGTLTPEYPGARGIAKSDTIKALINEHLESQLLPCAESLWLQLTAIKSAEPVLTKIIPDGVESIARSLRELHKPTELSSFKAARLTMERLAVLMAANAAMRGNIKGSCQPIVGPEFTNLSTHVPFTPTDEQQRAVHCVTEKMQRGIRSHSLLVGDVGTGKTVVFAMAARYALLSNRKAKVIVMLPNEALAHQVYKELCTYNPEVESSLVTSESKGELSAQLVVGTTALLFKSHPQPVELLIVDECQKFSRAQKEQIPCLHFLEASATPIPRTAALAQFGAVDVLLLKKAHTPKQIESRIWYQNEGDALMQSMMHTLSLGAKVLVVCPKRDESKPTADESMVSAERIAFALNEQFPGRVRMMHSGLSTEENEFALSEFKAQADILVSTTKIEVGVTVPGLRHVIVYNATRLGLTQLHQIRGRLARIPPKDGSINWGKFDMFLPSGAKEKALERLQVLVDSQDGFYISEMDMRLRGVGDLDAKSEKQHGVTNSGIRNVLLSVDRIASAVEYISQPTDSPS